jgi:hypothetical protein
LAAPATGSTRARSARDYRVEDADAGIPGLKGPNIDIETSLTGGLGHPLVDVDSKHRAAGGDTRAAPDVKHLAPGTGGDDCPHHDFG